MFDIIRIAIIQIANSAIGYSKRKRIPPETITTADDAIDILECGWITKKEFFACADYMNKIKLSGEEEEKFSRSAIVSIIAHEPWYDDYLEDTKK